MLSELERIEKELAKLTERRNAILNEENERKEAEQVARKKEVTDAYNKFVELLDKYMNDYNDDFFIKTTCSFG